MKVIIYKATSKTTGKSYIGQTSKKLCERKNEHKKCSINKKTNMIFHKAIRKHGLDDFEWSIEAVTIPHYADYFERWFIKHYVLLILGII